MVEGGEGQEEAKRRKEEEDVTVVCSKGMKGGWTQGNRSRLNSSTAKQHYSFPKARRFLEPLSKYPSPSTSKVQYIPHLSSLSKVSQSIGNGPRYDFTAVPARILHTEFCPCPSEPPTYSDGQQLQGHSRSLRSDQRLLHSTRTPEPTATSGGKAGLPRSQTPGPLTAVSGEEFDSFRTNCGKAEHGAYAVHRAKRRKGRSVEYYIASPGPGTYDPKTSLSTTGTYFLTNFQNIKTHSFAKAAKRDFAREKADTPGPGAYGFQSDFGSCGADFSPVKGKKRLNSSLA